MYQSDSVRNIGSVFDAQMKLEENVKQMCRNAYIHLRKIKYIRPYLSKKHAEVLVHAFVTSRIDFHNSLLYGLPQSLLNKVQKVQNAAARIISRQGRYDHITPTLYQLHWLPVYYRIQFKILILVYKCLNNAAPRYLSELLSIHTANRALRSNGHIQLCRPVANYRSYGDRAFSIAGPKLWNALPSNIRSSRSINHFKSQLKTHLFSKAF